MLFASMEKKHIITLGGLPGSGKSTVRDLLADKLGYKSFYTGGYSRQLAEERGLTLDEWNKQVAEDKALDELIDTEQIRINNEEDEYVIDAHIGYHFVPTSFKVFLTVPPIEGARRILGDSDHNSRKSVGDTMSSLEEAVERTKARIENHKDRYMRHYGINPYDESQFDLIVNTDDIGPEAVVEKIVSEYKKWLN